MKRGWARELTAMEANPAAKRVPWVSGQLGTVSEGQYVAGPLVPVYRDWLTALRSAPSTLVFGANAKMETLAADATPAHARYIRERIFNTGT